MTVTVRGSLASGESNPYVRTQVSEMSQLHTGSGRHETRVGRRTWGLIFLKAVVFSRDIEWTACCRAESKRRQHHALPQPVSDPPVRMVPPFSWRFVYLVRPSMRSLAA
jgi:hypothetical protein